VLLYTFRGKLPGDTIHLCGHDLQVKQRLDSLSIDGEVAVMLVNTYYIVVPDAKIIQDVYQARFKDKTEIPNLSYYYGFDVKGQTNDEVALTKALSERCGALNIDGSAQGVLDSKESFNALYGGLFFLGIFLGALFLMATVLIIYYKQVSEGYDDRARFEIMHKVGMSNAEIRQSIHSQVLMVFFIPLATAIVHIAFAFKVITKLLSVFNLTNISLFLGCTAATIAIFAAIYALVYSLTAKAYYRIVK
jgi:putative ABC transport system permease protein